MDVFDFVYQFGENRKKATKYGLLHHAMLQAPRHADVKPERWALSSFFAAAHSSSLRRGRAERDRSPRRRSLVEFCAKRRCGETREIYRKRNLLLFVSGRSPRAHFRWLCFCFWTNSFARRQACNQARIQGLGNRAIAPTEIFKIMCSC